MFKGLVNQGIEITEETNNKQAYAFLHTPVFLRFYNYTLYFSANSATGIGFA